MLKAPLRFKEVFDALKQFKNEVEQPVKVLVAHESSVQFEDLISKLSRDGQRSVFQVVELVDSDASGYVAELMAQVNQADLSVLLIEATGDFGAAAISFNVIAREAKKPYLVVSLDREGSGESTVRKERIEKFLEMSYSRMVRFNPDDLKSLKRLTEEMLQELAGKEIAVAARLPVFRLAAAERAISRTAWQNAFIGAATILPGTDMPILTFNQIKMILQIAAIYGEEMSVERTKELLAVVGGGFAFRAIARQLLDLIPGAGWLVKGGVAYSGTVVMGKAAQAYFESGRFLTAEDIKEIVGRAVKTKALLK